MKGLSRLCVVVFSGVLAGCVSSGGSSFGSTVGGVEVVGWEWKNCARAIDYDAGKLEIEGISIPVKEKVIEVAKFSASKESLRDATDVVALADLRQFEACQAAVSGSSSHSSSAAAAARDKFYSCVYAISRADTENKLKFAVDLCSG